MAQLGRQRPPEPVARDHVQQRKRTVVLEQADQTDLVLGQLAQHAEKRRVDAGRGVAVHRRRQQVQVALAQGRAVAHAPGQRLRGERQGGRPPPRAGDRRHPLAEVAERAGQPRRHLGDLPQGSGRQQRHRAEAPAEPAAQRQLAPRAQHQITDRARRAPHRLPLFSEEHAARLHDLFQFAHRNARSGARLQPARLRSSGWRVALNGIRRLVAGGSRHLALSMICKLGSGAWPRARERWWGQSA